VSVTLWFAFGFCLLFGYIRILYRDIESFEKWCWSWMEVTATDHVKNGEELLRLKEERNIERIKKRKEEYLEWVYLA